MRSSQVRRLSGMRDVGGATYERMRDVLSGLRALAGRRGYEVIDTPVLEDTELFARKSGGELTGQLYTFVDNGGRQISLRPEFTSSVIRHFIQEHDGTRLPARRQYGGPVFRYEPGGDSVLRQFTQFGAELIGIDGIQADVEVLGMAWRGLREAGLQGHRMRVGHLGALHGVLAAFGLSDSAMLFIIGGIQDLKSGHADVDGLTRQAREIGLLRDGHGAATGMDPATIGAEATRALVQRVLAGSISGPVGRRTGEEIAGRLLRKVQTADRPENFEAALDLAAELAPVEGPRDNALRRAREIVAAEGMPQTPFDELDALFDALASNGVDESRTILDFGLARGISYYSGVIFELVHPALPVGLSLGGGGRYDGLVKALGGDDVPALGFAYGLEQVVQALEHDRSEEVGGAGAATRI